MTHTHYPDISPFVTKDGSTVRELMHPAHHACRSQSLAEAIVQAGLKTALHRHGSSEELYHISRGRGLMTLGDAAFVVEPGDTVCIAPGTPHCIENVGEGPLHILCCCSPAYSDADTELLA